MEQQVASSVKIDTAHLQSEIATKLQPLIDAVVRVETTIQLLQEGFGEMALMVQTLQATSYSGPFIWKIPEVQRRRGEARSGRTVSLYSAPFYTSRHGYKMCLRLYMDGDGSGKGTHLSFFLTLMRREYDALLTWPFRQTVTLTLLDQNRQDTFQSFRPDPFSSLFQRPINEMNYCVASGIRQYASLSIFLKTLQDRHLERVCGFTPIHHLLSKNVHHKRIMSIISLQEVKLHHQERAQLKAKQPYTSCRWLDYWKAMLLASGDVETNPGPARMTHDQLNKVAEGQLEIDAHAAVLNAISSLSGRWRQLFTIVGLEDSQLSSIEKDNPRDVEQCLSNSIMQWLKCNYDIQKHEPPSWRSLVAAIDHSAGGQNHALAKKIAQDHEKIESDDDNQQRKATNYKGKTRRHCRGLVRLGRGHPYNRHATPIVVNMHFHGRTYIIHQHR